MTGHATVYNNILSRDIAGAFRKKKCSGLRNFSGRANSLHGYFGSSLLGVIQTVDIPRQQVVHANTFGRVTVGIQFGITGQACPQGA